MLFDCLVGKKVNKYAQFEDIKVKTKLLPLEKGCAHMVLLNQLTPYSVRSIS